MTNYVINSKPVVSIVIPMYNVEKYIDKCICSVLNQTYHNFEVICVDDGCSDNTLNYLRDYKDHRIHIIRQQNRGLSGARNTGIRNARGVYIALLDADDYWAVDKLEKHIAHLNRNPHVDVSYCPSLFVDDDNKQLGIGQFPKLDNIDAKTIFCRNPVGNGSAPVIRAAALEKVAFHDETRSWRQYFDENLRQSEDIEMWLRLALYSDAVFAGIPEPLTFYRVNASGLSANLQKQYQSWESAVNKHRRSHAQFFKQCGSLARAYQLRYLSRRAVQSRNTAAALKLIHKALFTDIRILLEEPGRTALTWCCALTSLLPKSLYDRAEKLAMRTLGQANKHPTS
ncbi:MULTISPECIES: glycosyltransferase family 2 protein [Pseudoalteromonas]|uniref:Glucosyl transferase n=2 Tax=Pseudoalteromonas TaxID=53246 RepID=A0A0F4QWT8_9GAMM|nr:MULTISPECIES: glycosyltransferase family 2 protein [Pseudoalteromonas]KJZ12181.1 glucosyl transferase [Pseudoalteromonas rubra]QTL35739.1 glycosyltransferase family 2 protein [Pseudoalteromonas viridis]